METTTILIARRVKKRLDRLRAYPKESYSSVIERLTLEEDKEPLSKEEIKKIKKALNDVEKGRVHTTEQIEHMIGIR
jgi:predicted transcriptional regulator